MQKADIDEYTLHLNLKPALSREELDGDAHVLGRMKELLSYWCQEGSWRRLWPSVKICRSTDELAMVCGIMK